MNIMKNSIIGLVTLTAVVSCASTSEKHSKVKDVRAQYEQLASDEQAQQFAPQRLNDAEQAVQQAESAAARDADEDMIEHYVYLAERRVAIANEAAELERAEKSIQDAEARRSQVMLDVREAQAVRAQQRAEAAEQRAAELNKSLSELENEIETIKTEQTDQGVVLTLRDILFNVNEDNLKPGAARTLDQVASFLQKYPERQLEIKGFTDNTGPASYNRELSERRALSVKDALVARGINSDRINIEGHGERFPVASNDTPAGRQQNRRVEILIQDREEDASVSLNRGGL